MGAALLGAMGQGRIPGESMHRDRDAFRMRAHGRCAFWDWGRIAGDEPAA
jgi:hypothetical protein